MRGKDARNQANRRQSVVLLCLDMHKILFFGPGPGSWNFFSPGPVPAPGIFLAPVPVRVSPGPGLLTISGPVPVPASRIFLVPVSQKNLVPVRVGPSPD